MRCVTITTVTTVTVIVFAASVSIASAQSQDDSSITASVELQSGPLTPALMLDESPRPIHQIRLLVDARMERGTLILDGNVPEFSEFGELVGGLQTPHVRDSGDPQLTEQLNCGIKLIKSGQNKWRLYELSGPSMHTPLRIASRGPIGDGGPARLIVLGPDAEVRAVVRCTTYGLVVP